MKSGDFMHMNGNQAWKPQVTQPICVGDTWGLEHLRQRGGDFDAVQPVKQLFNFGLKGLLSEGGNAQQFVGSATYTITLGKDNKTLEFSIYNETSKNSLMYHGLIPGIDATSHTREENPVMGTITQTYTFSEPLSKPKAE